MDNYVDCSQCPGIYGGTTAIYDPVEDTPMRIGRRHETDLLPAMPMLSLLISFEKKRCLLQTLNICNSSRKVFSSPQKLSQKIIFISLSPDFCSKPALRKRIVEILR